MIVRTQEPAEEPADLGFPAFATSNTTRVAGADSIEVAAGVALATFPTGGSEGGPNAVTLVPAAEWEAGVAAASLVAEPIGAPILLSDDDELPELSAGRWIRWRREGRPRPRAARCSLSGGRPSPGNEDDPHRGRHRRRDRHRDRRAAGTPDRGAPRSPRDRVRGRARVRNAGRRLGGPLG